jgi:hypothetical protein
MFQGYLRKGQIRPVHTGRTARRQTARIEARTFARDHGMQVIGHVQRALAAASRQGWLFAGDYLERLGVDARYAAAFGKAALKAYRENHGTEPDRRGLSIVNGRLRATYRYSNPLDLIAGALAYRRTADLILAMPGHPVAHAYAGV